MGRSWVASSSGAVGSVSGGAEEGDWEEDGEGEAMLVSGSRIFSPSVVYEFALPWRLKMSGLWVFDK